MTEIMPFPENNYETVLLDRPFGVPFSGADDRTRTCTLSRWNLNPMSLPIPPHPHILLYFCGGEKCSPAIASIFYHRVAGVVNGGEMEKNCGLFPLTFDLRESKMVSVWCTLGRYGPHCVSFITGVMPGFAFWSFLYDFTSRRAFPEGFHAQFHIGEPCAPLRR